MEYKTSAQFAGPADRAIERARLCLMTNGFKLYQPSDTQLVATGPGMHSTNQDPILGATRITVTVSSDLVDIEAELGGVRFMQLFVFLFPPALVAVMSFGFMFAQITPRQFPLVGLGLFVMWAIMSPLMARAIKNRTTEALDTLVHNMANVK